MTAANLVLVGDPPPANTLFIYTNEYMADAAADPARETLNDPGGADTLNLAAVSANCSINLTAGVAGMIGGTPFTIGAGTTVTTVYAGLGADTIDVNGGADTITGEGGNDTVVFPGAEAGYALVRNANQVTVTQGAVTDTLRGVTTLAFAGQKVAVDTIPCFAAGTRVLTARGEVPIEALRIGDRLPTVSGGRVARVAWLGHQRSTVAPVRVDPETLGEGMPHRPLILSPDHAVYVNGVLIPVQCLVNAATVGTAPMHSIDYWHVELDRHAAIVAGGLACESYLDTGNRHLLAPPSVPAKDAARRRG